MKSPTPNMPPSTQSELCFVWGPPLSGQRRWMIKSAEQSDPHVAVSLVFSNQSQDLPSLVKALATQLDKIAADEAQDPRPHHVYCELPWGLMYEDIDLEEWLKDRPEFAGPQPKWGLGFAGILTENLDLLDDESIERLEEFSRATQSSMIVIRQPASSEQDVPLWLEQKRPDFGRFVGLFQEKLWLGAAVHAVTSRPHSVRESFEGTINLTEVELPVAWDPVRAELILREALKGTYGVVWGAEILSGGAMPEGITLHQGEVHKWRSSKELSDVRGLSREVCMFQFSGAKLDMTKIRADLREYQLLIDS